MTATLFRRSQELVDAALERFLPSVDNTPSRLHDAMRYSVLGGGKRIRPALTIAVAEAFDTPATAVIAPASAVELIHAYSLIHDDLPAMDDDDLRRGRPTCHIAFDEATAVLAGDALQALAFDILSNAVEIPEGQRLAMVQVLSRASGFRGMVGGQALDLSAVGRQISLEELEQMHLRKTGALIEAAVLLGAICAEADRHWQEQLSRYARTVGLAFQVRDDILDVEGETTAIGKQQGADLARNKPTYPALLGLEEAKNLLATLHQQALESLEGLGPRGDSLRGVADFIFSLSH